MHDRAVMVTMAGMVWISLHVPAGEWRGNDCGESRGNRAVIAPEEGTMEFTEVELEAAIDAAGRRNIANWAEFSDYDRLQVRRALRKLALEWLRGATCGHSEDTTGNARAIAA